MKPLEPPTFYLCETPVHLEQLFREGSRLVPTAPAPNLQEGVFGVCLVSIYEINDKK